MDSETAALEYGKAALDQRRHRLFSGGLPYFHVILEKDRSADRRDQRGQPERPPQRPVSHAFDSPTIDRGEQHRRQQDECQRERNITDPGEPQHQKGDDRDKGADHVDLAMGKIDHADDAVHHRVADRDQPVDRPQSQAVDQLLQKICHPRADRAPAPPRFARKYAERPTTRKPTALLTRRAAGRAAVSDYLRLSRIFPVAPPTANLQQKIAHWLQWLPLPVEKSARSRACYDRFDNVHCESGNFWIEFPTAAEFDSLTGSGAYSPRPHSLTPESLDDQQPRPCPALRRFGRCGLRLDRPIAPRRCVERRGTDGARQCPRVLPGEALSAGARSQPARALRPRDHD